MTDWYYADAQNQRHGPLPASDLAALHAQGVLRPETLVWREGLAAWTPWRQVMQEVVPPTPAAAGAPPVPPPASDDASPYAPPRAALHDDSAVVAGNHVVYAGFWKRVAASIIDSFVTSMLFWVIMIPVFAIAGGGLSAISSLGDGTAGALFTAAYYLTSILIPMVYLAWMHSSSNQASLGKMAVGIKVVRTDGERISFLRGIGRYFGYMLSSLLLMIGLIMAAFTDRKQALHDFMCDTLVVDKHAFTSHPELQRDELGSVTIAILVLAGLFVVGMFVLIGIAIAAIAAGGWR